MPRFSERVGAREPRRIIQIDSMDQELRSSLWNVVVEHIGVSIKMGQWCALSRYLARDLFKTPIDQISRDDDAARLVVQEAFLEFEWAVVYDIVEAVLDYSDSNRKGAISKKLAAAFNHVLEREMSGYRIIDGVLAPITNPTEISSIEDAIESGRTGGLDLVSDHIEKAIGLLGKRPQPDYQNSIKESISAIESAVKCISKSSSRGLDGALGELGKKAPIHPALAKAFKNLYGYSSDEDGIRHAMTEKSNVGYEEAKYMLVACSAGANFLIAKAAAAGLLIEG